MDTTTLEPEGLVDFEWDLGDDVENDERDFPVLLCTVY